MTRRIGYAATASAAVLILAACGAGRTDTGTEDDGGGGTATSDSGATVVVGTTDKTTSLDPASSYDNGSFHVMTQVYSFVLNFPPGSNELSGDAAESCDFVEPTVYQCVLKDGMTFANGNPLTAESVKFSLERVQSSEHPNAPSALLGTLEEIEVVDPLTVNFHLTSENDQTFPQVLASPAGPIVDEQTFTEEPMSDEDIIAANAFSGPYRINTFAQNEVIEFVPNESYVGNQGEPQNAGVTLTYYTDANNMRLDIASGEIDVAWRSLTPTDVETLEGTDGVNVVTGPGGEIRYIVFNFDTMPGEDDEQKLAIRKAIAASIDREAISEQVYRGTMYVPLYSYVPDGLPGAAQPFADIYGTTPDPDAAAAFLEEAGVDTPVALNIQYSPDHYGPSSGDEYNEVKRQLESTGLFTVTLEGTEWVTYAQEYNTDGFPIYQLGWFPDYPDADNYLTPFFSENNFLNNHFSDPEISDLLAQELTEADPDARAGIIEQIQQILAEEHVPTLPLLQGAQVAVVRDGVTGVENTLDASFKFRYTVIGRS